MAGNKNRSGKSQLPQVEVASGLMFFCRPTIALFAISLLLTAQGGCNGKPDVERRGFLTKTYRDASGSTFHYVVFVPQVREADRKLPVILFLNGWGENGNDGLRQISNNFGADVWRMRGHFPFLAVCPQCSYDGNWTPGSPNAEKALAILDQAIVEHNGDPNRVCVTGASMGGGGALELASAYPDRFAAVVPVATGEAGNLKELATTGMPIWSFYNAADSSHLVASARGMRRKLLEMGMSPFVTEYASIMTGLDRYQHNAWHAAYGSPAVYCWMLQQDRRERSREPFQLVDLEEILREWERRGPDVWFVADGELHVNNVGEAADAVLVAPPVVLDGEIHVDVFLTDDACARVVLLQSDSIEPRSAEIVLELPDSGTGGLRGPDGEWLAPCDPAAQRTLRIGWNDLRLSRADGRLIVKLNGWSALNVEDPLAGHPIRWGLRASPSDPVVRWRFLRYRGLRPVQSREVGS